MVSCMLNSIIHAINDDARSWREHFLKDFGKLVPPPNYGLRAHVRGCAVYRTSRNTKDNVELAIWAQMAAENVTILPRAHAAPT
eukprot:2930139-Prymnesium_polylepis.1